MLVSTWNAMLDVLGRHGRGHEALRLFKKMQEENFSPNETTFSCVLSACSHAGLVEEAWEIYHKMEESFKIIPTITHQACLIDALSRSGDLERAENYVLEYNPTASALWKTLLGASLNYNNIKLAERAAEKCIELSPEDPSVYILMGNTYASVGNHQGRDKMWKDMKARGLAKIPGITWGNFNGKTETFFVNDRNHQYL